MVFLVTVRPTQRGPVKYDRTKPFREQVILLQRGSTEVDRGESRDPGRVVQIPITLTQD